MAQKRKNLYAYVDESGQDTRGLLFVVGVVVLEEHRDKIQSALEGIEARTKKRNMKWHKSRPAYRQAYIRVSNDSYGEQPLETYVVEIMP